MSDHANQDDMKSNIEEPSNISFTGTEDQLREAAINYDIQTFETLCRRVLHNLAPNARKDEYDLICKVLRELELIDDQDVHAMLYRIEVAFFEEDNL